MVSGDEAADEAARAAYEAAYLVAVRGLLDDGELFKRERFEQLTTLRPETRGLLELVWGGDGDTLAELTQQELLDALRKAVLSLPAQYREVIVLCDLEQMTQAGAAELLQCSPGTVASRMHRARAMLREKMVQRG